MARVSVVALGLLLPDAAPAQGGGGFHGVNWGTPRDEIRLLDGTSASGRSPEGRVAYATDLRLLGMATRAVFYFDSADGGLSGGKYMAEPAPLSCVAQFRTLRLMLASDPEADSVELRRGTGAGAGTLREACDRFREASSVEDWLALFRDRETGRVTARVRLFRDGPSPRLLACVRVEEDCRWPPGREVGEGPLLAPPARRDTGASQPA